MTIHAILWDLDGTLADTELGHFEAWRATLADYGIDHTYEQFMAGFGRTNAEILPGILGDAATSERIHEIGEKKEANFRRYLAEQPSHLLPGVANWLARFQGAGLRQAIASSGPMINIVAMIHALGVGDFFQSIISGARLPKGKPDPAIFLLAAASLGATPAHSLVIEDSLAGITAARAGMPSVAVGKIIHDPALHEIVATITAPPSILVATLEELRVEKLGLADQ